jgi:hypothetical protein
MNMRKYQIGQSNKYFNFSDIHVQINVIQSKSLTILSTVYQYHNKRERVTFKTWDARFLDPCGR